MAAPIQAMIAGLWNVIKWLGFANATTSFVSMYQWKSNGFGAKYADPATLPAGAGNGIAIKTTLNGAVAVAHATSPYVTVYPWGNGISAAAGFGVKYSNPSTTPTSSGYSVAWDAAGTNIVVGHASSPFIALYAWSNGFGSRSANPTVLPGGTVTGVAVTGAAGITGGIAAVTSVSPYIYVYNYTAGILGVNYSNPATLPPGTCTAVAFNSAGTLIACVSSVTPFIDVYPWNYTTGFGTKYANPATLATTSLKGVSFNSATGAIAAVMSSATYAPIVWAWSSGFGSKYADPATTLASGSGIAFDSTGANISISTGTSPYQNVYPWSAGFGVKYADPTTAMPASSSTTFSH